MTQTLASRSNQSSFLLGRELEQHLLLHLQQDARLARDDVQANVSALTASLLMHRYPSFAEHCHAGAMKYFSEHPAKKISAAEMVRRGWVLGLPRWRDAVERIAGAYSPAQS